MNASIVEAMCVLGLSRPRHMQTLTGGCMHDVQRVDLHDGLSVVCKIGRTGTQRAMLRSEHIGLQAISAVQAIRTPGILGMVDVGDDTVLVLEYLEPGGAGDWIAFGRALAALHLADVHHIWGFDSDTWLGAFRQPNAPMDDWHEFLRLRRLEPQVRLAADRDLLSAWASKALTSVLDRLESIVPVPKYYSLLHGDCWSGNCLVTASGEVAVLDPAPWVGDAWSDIAMARLFGGVPEAAFDAWSECIDDHTAAASRIDVHQLYHLLNHLNLFGGGYAAQVEAVLRRLA
jgi:fructosamine-3-kinase